MNDTAKYLVIYLSIVILATFFYCLFEVKAHK